MGVVAANMETMAAAVLLAVLALPGCGGGECLDPVANDVSPPLLSMTIVYRTPSTHRPDTLHLAAADSAVQIEADNAGGVSVRYEAQDPEGMRRLYLGVAVLTTVGVGIESKRAPVEPLVGSCPLPGIAGDWKSPPGDPGRSVTLGLVAENWYGLRASTQTVTVRLR